MTTASPLPPFRATSPAGFTNAADFGFSPEATGLANAAALQRAVDQGGTIVVTQPGTYHLARTVYLGSHTALEFGSGVCLRKVDEEGPFTHVFLNRGALTRTYDRDIVLRGLHLVVNGIDVCRHEIYGLRGHVSFFYVKDLRIQRFRCLDLGAAQFCLHICTFEDVIIDDVIIKGDKDGVHFGPGRRFTVRNGVFQTLDDAIALNAHDYATANPEMGWIEDGVVENCHDLAGDRPIGFICRILAGAWCDWRPGMSVQQSDTVVHAGRLYRVQARADGTSYTSTTPPTHAEGQVVLDGIPWGMAQTHVTHTAGVRRVVFRDIFLSKPRVAFSVHFDHDKFSRSYYPGAPVPVQEQLTFENIQVLHDEPVPLLAISTPVDAVTIAHSSLRANRIRFFNNGNTAIDDHGPTHVNLIGCTFRHHGAMDLVTNEIPAKTINLQTTASVVLQDDFTARVSPGSGTIHLRSDIPSLSSAGR